MPQSTATSGADAILAAAGGQAPAEPGPGPQTLTEQQLLTAASVPLVGVIDGINDVTPEQQSALVQAAGQLLLAVGEVTMPGAPVADFLISALRLNAPGGISSITAAQVTTAVQAAITAIAPSLRSAGIIGATSNSSGGGSGSVTGGGSGPTITTIKGIVRPLDPAQLIDKPALPTSEEIEELYALIPNLHGNPRAAPAQWIYANWGKFDGTPELSTIRSRLQTAFAIESTSESPQTAAGSSLTALGFVRVTPTLELGQKVHAAVQQQYITSHPGNLICADLRVSGGGDVAWLSDLPKLPEKPRGKSTGDTLTDTRLELFRDALKFSSPTMRGGDLRADIADFHERTLLEIKPTGGAQEAVLQLWSYQAYANAAYQLLGRDLSGRDYLMREGTWVPDPGVYQITDDVYTVVFQFPGSQGVYQPLPGILFYELYQRDKKDEDQEARKLALELLRSLILREILRRLGVPPQDKGGGGTVPEPIPFPIPRPIPVPDPAEEEKAAMIHFLAVLGLIVTGVALLILTAYLAAVVVAAAIAAIVAAILYTLASILILVLPIPTGTRPEDKLALTAEYLDLVSRAGVSIT